MCPMQQPFAACLAAICQHSHASFISTTDYEHDSVRCSGGRYGVQKEAQQGFPDSK